jgi:hypothetical protein
MFQSAEIYDICDDDKQNIVVAEDDLLSLVDHVADESLLVVEDALELVAEEVDVELFHDVDLEVNDERLLQPVDCLCGIPVLEHEARHATQKSGTGTRTGRGCRP